MTRLTMFALPKPFEGHIGLIQRNAIRSWARLEDVDLILLGDEDGTAEMAAEVGAAHVRGLERNEFGTPLVSSCFTLGESASSSGLLAYVNADVILMSDFRRAVERVARMERPLLMAGRRTDLDVDAPLSFEEGWEYDLRAKALGEGRLMDNGGIDYFVFRRGLWPDIPPFAIGRWVWDNWLLYDAVEGGARLIDATADALAVHQNHGYAHFDAEGATRRDGPEAEANHRLHPERTAWYSLHNASHLLRGGRILPAWTPDHLHLRLRVWIRRRRALHAFLTGTRDRLFGAPPPPPDSPLTRNL